MLINLQSPEFCDDFLLCLAQDPVHGISANRGVQRRCQTDRNIFFWLEDSAPVAVLCVAYTLGLTDTVKSILDDSSPVAPSADHAIFYSVFRTTAPAKTKNVGATLIREAAAWIKQNVQGIEKFVTMSPIPQLSKHFDAKPDLVDIADFLANLKDPVARFHIRNGAQLLRVIPNADDSDLRSKQSWKTMVNYDYTTSIC